MVPPTAPLNVTFPVPPNKVRSWAPLTVLESVRAPAPLPVLMLVVPVKVIGFKNEALAFAVVKVPERLTFPPPFCVNVEIIDVEGPAFKVNNPEFVRVTTPEVVVIKDPSTFKILPAMTMPAEVLVLRLPM